MRHVESINQENQQIISQKQLKNAYDNGRQTHTNFGNSVGCKVHSLYIGNTVYVKQK